jgi:hypothetical protein
VLLKSKENKMNDEITARDSGNACDNCRFSQDVNETTVFCRRKPPTVFMVGQQGLQGAIPVPIGFFPPVSRREWCGEWKMKIQAFDNA